MHLKSLIVVALGAAGALAELEDRQLKLTDSVAASVLLVLATALPPESISQATANPSAFASDLASSVSAGDIPEWYQSLPADVKSYLPKLYPVAAAASTTPPATSTPTSTAVVTSTSAVVTSTVVLSTGTAVGTGASISGSTIGSNSTAITTISSATLTGPGSATGTDSVPTGAASYPTIVAGAGIAGAIAFLGMLAM